MAKKHNDVDLGQFNLDDELNFDVDFNPPEPPPLGKRDAILAAPRAVVGGAADALVGRGKRKQLIRAALPRKYSETYDAYDNLAKESTKVFEEARDHFRKTKQEVKRAGRAVLPIVKDYMPKKLYEKAQSALGDGDYKYSNYDPKEAEIDSATTNIFSQQPNQREEQEQLQQRAEGEINKQVDALRANKLVELVAGINHDMGNVVGYQNTVTTDYRRKMLELSYRQYFAMTDLVELTKKNNETTLPALDSIVKNTALPDYAKEEFGEITAGLMKRKLAEMISPANFMKGYVNKFGENLRGKMGEMFKGLQDGIRTGGDLATTMHEEDKLLSPSQRRAKSIQTSGNLAGEFIAKKWINPHVKKLQDKVRAGLTEHEGFNDFMQQAQYYATGAPEILNTYAKNPMYEGAEKSIMQPFAKLMGSLLPQFHGEAVSLGDRSADTLGKAAKWDNKSALTLNEIIPGYLAKIDQSIRSLSGENASLEQYDPKLRTYVNVKDVTKHIQATLKDEDRAEWFRYQQDELVKKIDPDKKLSEDDHTVLRKLIDEKMRKGEKWDARDFAQNMDAYGSAAGGRDISKVMSHFEGLSQDPKKAMGLNNDVSSMIRIMRDELNSTQENINTLTDRYGQDALVRAKVFNNENDRLIANRSLFSSEAKFDPEAPESDQKNFIHRIMNAVEATAPAGPAPKPTPAALVQQQALTEDTIAGGMRKALYGEPEPNLPSLLKQLQAGKVGAGDKREALNPLIDAIHQQLVANNMKPEIEHIISLMEEMLKNGIRGHGPIDSDAGNDPDDGSSIRDTLWGHAKRLPGRAMQAGLDGVKFGYKHMQSQRARVHAAFKKWMPNPLASALSLGQGVLDAAKGFKKGLLGDYDIYDADGKLILVGKLLKAGKYFDKDGKVIKKISDITGAIYDELGNIVIPTEEIQQKLAGFKYHTARGWKLLMAQGGSLLGRMSNAYLGMPAHVMQQLGKLQSYARNHLTTSRDIYVKGESEPRLRRDLMLKNYYISMTSKKPIHKPQDIDGPVISKYGEVIITSSELSNKEFQLVDIDGKPFKSIARRMFDNLEGAVKTGYGVLKGAAAFGKRMVNGALDMIGAGGEWVSKLLEGNLSISIGSKKTVKRLDDIYQLLDDRLPDRNRDRKEKAASGDQDGDGDRDNGYLDILARRKAAREAKEAAAKAKDPNAKPDEEKKSGGIGDILKKLLGGALSMIGSTLSSVFKLGGNLLGGGLMTVLKKGLGPLFTSVLMPLFTGGASLISKAVTGIATSAAGKAVGGGLMAAGRVAGSLAMSAASTLAPIAVAGAEWIGAAAMSALGVLTAPVTLGVMALGAAAYLGYRWYNSKSHSELDQLRFAYYGTEDYDAPDSDDAGKLRYLEDVMVKYTIYDGQGVSAIKGIDREGMYEIAKNAGVEVEDEEVKHQWEQWLVGRFMPVYLLWTTRLRQTNRTFKDISDPKLLPVEEKKKLFTQTMLPPDHPVFKVMIGPFDDEDLLSGEDVNDILRDLQKDLDKDVKQRKDIANLSKDITANGGNLWDTPGKSPAVANLSTAPLPPKQTPVNTMSPQAMKGPNDMDRPDPLNEIKTKPAVKGRHMTNFVNAVDAVRLKTYGLTYLTEDRVKRIYALEEAVYPFLLKENNNFIFKGSIPNLVKDHATVFGYTADKAEHVTEFTLWLSTRFIPTLIQHMQACNALLPNANPFDLTISSATPGLYDIAAAVKGAQYKTQFGYSSVWTVAARPFFDMDIANQDQSSVDGNMDYLLRLRKEFELRQQTDKGEKQGPKLIDDRKKVTDYTTKSPGAGKQREMSDVTRSVMEDVQSGEVNGPTTGESTNADYSGGTDNATMDKGTGGYFDIHTNGKSRQEIIELIKKAAKLVGVDANLLLTVGMMESTLDPNAGAKTSGAKGLYQFIPDTWKEQMGIHANEFGIPAGATPFDATANAILGAQYIKDAVGNAKKVIGNRQVNPVDIYMSHFLGPGGGRKFLKNLQANPDRIAAMDFGINDPPKKSPAKANRPVFAANDGKGDWMTYAQVYNRLQQRARSNFSQIAEYGDKSSAAAPTTTTAQTPSGEVKAPAATSAGISGGGGVPPAANDAEKANASTAKAANDVKATTKAATVNDAVTPNAPNTLVDDKPYAANAAQVANAAATGSADSAALKENNQKLKAAIEVEKVKQTAVTDNSMRQTAASQSTQTASSDTILTEQYKLQRIMVDVLREISGKLNVKAANWSGQPGAASPSTSVQQPAPSISHESAPISVGRKRA